MIPNRVPNTMEHWYWHQQVQWQVLEEQWGNEMQKQSVFDLLLLMLTQAQIEFLVSPNNELCQNYLQTAELWNKVAVICCRYSHQWHWRQHHYRKYFRWWCQLLAILCLSERKFFQGLRPHCSFWWYMPLQQSSGRWSVSREICVFLPHSIF